jgi:outer membrane protein assembly factor BamB
VRPSRRSSVLRLPPLLLLLVAASASAAPAGFLWRAATGGQIRSRPALGKDGTAYALAEDSALYAWVSGSSLLWRHQLADMPADCLAVAADGTAYAGLRNGDFIAVNRRGAQLWSVRLDGVAAGDPAVARDGTVLVGTSAGTLVALSHLGRRVWSVTLPGAVTQPPVIDGAGTIYVVAADRRLYALTPWGDFKWSLPLPAAATAPAVMVDGSLAIGTSAGDVVVVSPGGDPIWRHQLGAPVVGVSASSSGVVAATTTGVVAGFAADGSELWRSASPRPLATAPLMDDKGTILQATDGTLMALDAAHSVAASFSPGATGGAVLGPDGTVLVGGRDWVVYAVDRAVLTAGAPVGGADSKAAPWPQPGYDASHTGRTDAAPPSDNAGLLAQDPDYLYLQGIGAEGGRDGIQVLLTEIGRRIADKALGKSTWYAVRMLEQIAGSGVLQQVRENQRLVNDFPDLRAAACVLLARVGTTGSRDVLLSIVNAETDGVALAAEVRALGAIASDGDGASERAIARAFTRTTAFSSDNRLAAAVVDSLGRISIYEGALMETTAVVALLAISRGPYDLTIRQDAALALQGTPKTAIIDAEE